VGFLRKNSSEIVKIFTMQNLLIEAKLIIIRQLEKVKGMKTLMRTSTGYRVTAPEGFVALSVLFLPYQYLLSTCHIQMQSIPLYVSLHP